MQDHRLISFRPQIIFFSFYIYYCSKVWGQLDFIFFKEINTSIQQICIKLIKSDSKDIYNAFILTSTNIFNIYNNKNGVSILARLVGRSYLHFGPPACDWTSQHDKRSSGIVGKACAVIFLMRLT